MNRKKKIGLLMPLAIQQGGAEALLMHLLTLGSQRFDFVCLFLTAGPLVEEAGRLGYPTYAASATRVSSLPNFVKTARWLRGVIRREQLDGVVSWMPKAHLYSSAAAVRTRAKTMWFQHGLSDGRRIDRIISALPAQLVLCCSEAVRERQLSLRADLRTAVCYPGVEFSTSGPIDWKEARAQLNLDTTRPLVGMVARLERWKGAHVFVETAALVLRERPDVRFFLVGGAHPRDLAYAEEVQNLVIRHGIGDSLVLVGQRPRSEIPLWQASADLIVHPVVGAEPFGMAVAEAMGMGRVVIATGGGGPLEMIENDVNGVLLPTADASAIALEINRLLEDPQRRARIADQAYYRGRSFTVSRFGERFEELVGSALDMGN